MVCPNRVDHIYETKRVGDAIVVTAIREVYSECHESQCPCYICEGYCTEFEGRNDGQYSCKLYL